MRMPGEYADYISTTGMAEYRSAGQSGRLDATTRRRDPFEIITFTLWDSRDSIRAFAGEDIDQARFLSRGRPSSSNVICQYVTTRLWPSTIHDVCGEESVIGSCRIGFRRIEALRTPVRRPSGRPPRCRQPHLWGAQSRP